MKTEHPFTYSFTTCFKERAISKMLGTGPEGKVLEMGCGSAYFSTVLDREFPSSSFEYYGIDMEKDAVSAAKKFVKDDDKITMGSVEEMGYEDNSFDHILYLDVIEHVNNDKASIEEAFRVLRPGGKIIVSTPNSGAALTDTFLCEYMHDHGHMENQRDGYYADELSSLLTDAGFKVDTVEYSNVFLSEILITITKLGYRVHRPKYNSQADVVGVQDSMLFKLHKKLFFPVGYAIGRMEEMLFKKFFDGHCLIISATKPKA